MNATMREEDWSVSYFVAGLGMMASKNPQALGAIGEGGLKGVQAYVEGRKADSEIALHNADTQGKLINNQMAGLTLQGYQAMQARQLARTPQITGQGGQTAGIGNTSPSSLGEPLDAGSDPRGVAPVIRAAALKYGVDPGIAMKVAQSEGLGTFAGDHGKSFGAFQLYTGGGMGNDFQRDTGLDPSDPKNEAATIDYALKRAAQGGWGPWHGAARVGITGMQGIGTAPTGAADTVVAANNNAPAAPPSIRTVADTSGGTAFAPGQGSPAGSGDGQVPPMFDAADLAQQYRIASATPGMQQLASQTLQALQKGVPEGAYLGTDGGIHFRPGFVQGQATLAGAKAAAEDANRTQMGRPGSYILHGGVPTGAVPERQLLTDPVTGREYPSWVTPPLPGQVGPNGETGVPAAGGAPTLGGTAGQLPAKLGPGETTSLTKRADIEQTAREQTLKEAQGAQYEGATLANLRENASNFYTGPFSDWVGDAQKIMRLVDPAYDKPVASREQFMKDAGSLTRQATHDASPKAAFQEMRFIQSSLPNPDMSPKGLDAVLGELQGLSDYKTAKATAQSQWEMAHGGLGHVEGFESNWQASAPVTPYTFILSRMDPGARQQLFSKWAGTDQGRQELQKLAAQRQYALTNGLLP